MYNVIYGPPGTGKTTELLRIVNNICDSGVDPKSICFVSFTRAASKEIKQRINLPTVNISTIHSLAYKTAQLTAEQVINKESYKKFYNLTGFRINGFNPEDQEDLTTGDYLSSMFSLCKNLLSKNPDDVFMKSSRLCSLKEFKIFVKKYTEFKSAYGLFDFSDMLLLCLEKNSPEFEYMFVDEAQDLSPLQWKLVEHWMQNIPNVYIAGDDDQSLYSWGGADPNGMHKFTEKYSAKVTTLGQSYRVPKVVHELADSVISNVKNRVKKIYLPKADKGQIRKFNSPYAVPPPQHGEDTLILYRNHSLRADFEQVLIDHVVPYVVDSGKPGMFYNSLSRAVKLYITAQSDQKTLGRVLLKSNERSTLAKFCPKYQSKIKKGNFEFIEDKHWSKVITGNYENISYLHELEKKNLLFVTPTVHISTIHGSKGREAERVILFNALGERSAEALNSDPDPELRNFYVAITRSKKILDIVYGKNNLPYL